MKHDILITHGDVSIVRIGTESYIVKGDTSFVSKIGFVKKKTPHGMCVVNRSGNVHVDYRYTVGFEIDKAKLNHDTFLGTAYNVLMPDAIKPTLEQVEYYHMFVHPDPLDEIKERYNVIAENKHSNNCVSLATDTPIDKKYKFNGEPLCNGYSILTVAYVSGANVFYYIHESEDRYSYASILEHVFEEQHDSRFADYALFDGKRYSTCFSDGEYSTRLTDKFIVYTKIRNIEYKFDSEGNKYFEIK